MGPSVFERLKQYIDNLSYAGPVGMSCDDTQLHPAFRTFWDASTQTHVLVGGTSGPITVADPKQLEQVINDSAHLKAVKVSLCLIYACINNVYTRT